jgi:hypothetical protein
MPNGGSDCCGTCWFNTRNHGQAGHGQPDRDEPSFCEIRGNLPIPNPFWTYCSNHPHHNPDRVRIPVGPVYADAGGGFPYRRAAWAPSPDTEAVRAGLLDLVRSATAESARNYPGGFSLVEATVRQLGEFREPRAVPELDRIRGFSPTPASDEPFARDPGRLVALARQALLQIIPPQAVTPYSTPTAVSLAGVFTTTGDPGVRPVLADALEEAGCTHTPALTSLRTPIPPGGRCWVVDLVRGEEPLAD